MPTEEKERQLLPNELDLIEESEVVTRNDESAKEEEEDLFQKNVKKRADSKKRHMHNVFVVFIWIGLFVAVAVLFVRIYHLIMPIDSFWLSDDQIQQMDKVLFSGFIGGFLGKYVGEVLKTHHEDLL